MTLPTRLSRRPHAEGVSRTVSNATDWVQAAGTVVIAGIALYSGIKGTKFIDARQQNEIERPVETPGDVEPVEYAAPPPSPLLSTAQSDGPLAQADLGKMEGPDGHRGALIVRLQYGGTFSDPARPKYGPGHDSDAIIRDNTVRSWAIGPLTEYWRGNPDEIPDRLIGVTGPVENRIIISSLKIDRRAMGAASAAEPGVVNVDESDKETQALNYMNLRNRQVTGVRFGNISPAFFIWVDDQGRVRAGGRDLVHVR